MPRPARGTVLAFDFGEKRIGVAVGEIELGISHAYSVITAEDNDSRFFAIDALITDWRPVCLVVGVAANADGAPHETGRLAQRFGRRLQGRFSLPVDFVDERLTSHAAETALRDAGMNKARRADLLDAAAAAEILLTWLNNPPTGTQ